MVIDIPTMQQILYKNFQDVRISAIQLYIQRLLRRNKISTGINEFRIKNLVTGQYVTSMNEFETLVSTQSLTMSYHFNSDRMSGDHTHPVLVVLDTLQVELNPNSNEDEIFINTYGRLVNRIAFSLNYMSDSDLDLPVKIFEVKLV